MAAVKHLDITTDGEVTAAQKNGIIAMAATPTFSTVCVYLNSEYIGGRPNDRG